MTLPFNLQEIQKFRSLDEGRQVSNENDLKLAAQLLQQLAPSYVHSQSVPDTAWIVKHNLGTKYLDFTLRDSEGKVCFPKRILFVSDNIILVEWSKARTGECVVFLGKEALPPAGDQEVGLPQDGSWDDGAAHILSTDTIATALDKINEVIASLYTPPAALAGALGTEFGGGESFHSGYLSRGTGQNLSLLAAGALSNNIILTDDFRLKPGTLQFANADQGTLAFLRGVTVVDSVDLATPFEESKRAEAQTWPALDGWGLSGALQVTEVTCYNHIPNFQKGAFLVHGSGYLDPGENGNLHVTHSSNTFSRSTSNLTLFYDDGSVPSIPATGAGDFKSVQAFGHAFTLNSGKLLDGIRYYGLGDQVIVAARVQNAFNRTYSNEVVRFEMPGLEDYSIPVSDPTVCIGRALSTGFADDNFNDNSLDTDLWEVVESTATVSETSNALQISNAFSGVAKAGVVRGRVPLIRGTLWTLKVSCSYVGGTITAGNGYEFGVVFDAIGGGGSIEYVYRKDDAGVTTLRVYKTPDNQARALVHTASLTLVGSDVLTLKVLCYDSGFETDKYRFYYGVNDTSAPTGIISYPPPESEAPDGTLSFGSWDETTHLYQLRYALSARNDKDTAQGDFAVAFDNLTFSSGYGVVVSTIDTVPDITDQLFVLGKVLTLDKSDDMSVDTTPLSATPLSPRGEGSAALNEESFLFLINTAGQTSTATTENFDDNTYRLKAGTYSSKPTGSDAWDNAVLLTQTDLQVYGGKLVYPSINFTTNAYPTQNGSADYSGFFARGYYYRKVPTNGPKSHGRVIFDAVTLDNLLQDDIRVHLRIPGRTGWLDLAQEYDPNTFTGADDDGCRMTTDPLANEIEFTFGQFSTELPTSTTGGMAILRISMPPSPACEPEGLTFPDWS